MYHIYHFYLDSIQTSYNTLVFYFWKTHKLLCYWSHDVMNDVIGTCLTYQTKAHYITLWMAYNTYSVSFRERGLLELLIQIRRVKRFKELNVQFQFWSPELHCKGCIS